MRVAELQIAPWEKNIIAPVDDLVLKPGDVVLVKSEVGVDLATVLEITDRSVAEEGAAILKSATAEDWQKMLGPAERQQALQVCHQLIKQLSLNMKLVDVRLSYDTARLTFAFVANGRIDFRDLVKELTKHFGKTIRLQQIGIRDEAKMVGDQGRCGRGLCCREHLNKFSSVTSEVAEVQNLVGRGSDRLSGACGRLMCCLAYEAAGYKDMAGRLPVVGDSVTVKGKRGTVIGRQVLKGCVDVKFKGEKGEADFILEVPWDKDKK